MPILYTFKHLIKQKFHSHSLTSHAEFSLFKIDHFRPSLFRWQEPTSVTHEYVRMKERGRKDINPQLATVRRRDPMHRRTDSGYHATFYLDCKACYGMLEGK